MYGNVIIWLSGSEFKNLFLDVFMAWSFVNFIKNVLFAVK